MAKGTDFGGVHSSYDLHLIQQTVDVQPPKLRLNIVDIKGADGAKDLSDMPAGRATYGTRKITWTFALYPEDKWAKKHQQVCGELHGKNAHITIDGDPEYYYTGRLSVSKYKSDGLLHRITVEATCQPYKLKQLETSVARSLTTAYTTLRLLSDRKPVVPTITVSAETTLRWKGNTFTLAAGTHKVLDIEFTEGENVLEAKTVSGTGTITLKYQEGAL